MYISYHSGPCLAITALGRLKKEYKFGASQAIQRDPFSRKWQGEECRSVIEFPSMNGLGVPVLEKEMKRYIDFMFIDWDLYVSTRPRYLTLYLQLF